MLKQWLMFWVSLGNCWEGSALILLVSTQPLRKTFFRDTIFFNLFNFFILCALV